jgi:hypothetical protein
MYGALFHAKEKKRDLLRRRELFLRGRRTGHLQILIFSHSVNFVDVDVVFGSNCSYILYFRLFVFTQLELVGSFVTEGGYIVAVTRISSTIVTVKARCSPHKCGRRL